MNTLYKDLHLLICDHLKYRSKMALSLVNKYWRKIVFSKLRSVNCSYHKDTLECRICLRMCRMDKLHPEKHPSKLLSCIDCNRIYCKHSCKVCKVCKGKIVGLTGHKPPFHIIGTKRLFNLENKIKKMEKYISTYTDQEYLMEYLNMLKQRSNLIKRLNEMKNKRILINRRSSKYVDCIEYVQYLKYL